MLKQLINFYKVSSPRPCNGEALSSSGSQHLHSDARRLKYLKWSTFLSATFGYGMYYVCRLSLNVVKKPIVDEGIFSETELGSQGKPAYAAIINRLDRPVSGLLLIAKNKSAAAKYSTLMQKEGGFNKQYEALICGKLSEPKGTFVDYLKKDGRNNTSVVVPSDAAANDKEAKLSKLEYEVISYDEVKDITHVRIHLITGALAAKN